MGGRLQGLQKWPAEVQKWGGESEGKNRDKTRITTAGGRGGGRKEKVNPLASVSGERRRWRGGSWIPSMQAAWNGWGSSGLSARCPRARETERDTARETRIGSAVTPPPRLTRRREPAVCPLRNPTAPARRSRPLTMTRHECCLEAESRRWSTRRVQSTAGQVSKNKCLLEPHTVGFLAAGSHMIPAKWCAYWSCCG